ncbi:DEAD/DEAH box helicase [Streptomyces sp. NP160]|uniref:DEAD/DEAH box helicase n=1 Tax=Streptomyces sp. NP160 TaxID=2586637 RepID=UPI0011190CEB|nr:DEAD/DEAH box helicase [Streptomyces sp. NP160]TNM66872.1 DEAD/DEAH box helicase [Streptomyces sp. NP160]
MTAGEEDGRTSTGFARLHPRIQHWIWQQRWDDLRDAQERAVAPILAGDCDLIISAATASGKTEAAFLPICTALLTAQESPPSTADDAAGADGVQVLYLAPLKALINDQFGRLEALCEHLELPVHRWHGDVAGSRKAKVIKDPSGLLLITPESLEALLVIHGPKVGRIFGGLRYVVIDEMHSFLGTERGAQLQSLLHRIELVLRRRIPRIGLSATLGDASGAREFLRPADGERVLEVVAEDDGQELQFQLRGYEAEPPLLSESEAMALESAGKVVEPEDVTTGDRLAIAEHLFTTLRGSDNLIFANSRREVETYADLLARRSAQARVPNEFVPHHGSLSKDLREDAESRLKDRSVPVNAVCTSTLEMGIDIGSVNSIAQLGAPHTVASLRQRLGRSGRRGGAATLRLYVTEDSISPQTPPPDALRVELVQSIAMIELLLGKWNESPGAGGLHLSTLVQQLLSLIAQHGGVTAVHGHRALCSQGPFAGVDAKMFVGLLRGLGAADLITQSTDGLLLLGLAGERIVNHYSFYAAFATAQEYRLIANGRSLGTLPLDYPLMSGSLLIFGGRRWKVITVDTRNKVVELIRSTGGRPPTFSGSGGEVADEVRRRMRSVLAGADVPTYLNVGAVDLLAEGRLSFQRLGLAADPVIAWGADTLLFPWRGDRIMSTLALALTGAGAEVAQDGVCLTMTKTTRGQAIDRMTELLDAGPPDPLALAAMAGTKVAEKYDDYLTEELQNAGFAARSLDVPGAWAALETLLKEIPVEQLRDH